MCELGGLARARSPFLLVSTLVFGHIYTRHRRFSLSTAASVCPLQAAVALFLDFWRA